VCDSDTTLLPSSKHLSQSTDCVFVDTFDVTSDFASSATGRKSPDDLDVKSQDESRVSISTVGV